MYDIEYYQYDLFIRYLLYCHLINVVILSG